MKLLSIKKTETYKEIEVERSFLFIKWKVKYRNFDGCIFKFKEPNYYLDVGFSEHFEVKNLFYINL